jgi:competence protein ComEA
MRLRNVPHIFALGILFVTLLSGCGRGDETTLKTTPNYERTSEAININTATKEELQRIPFVGEKLADAIIEHRERYGAFRRPEHLLLIKGVSDKRFRQIRHLIRVD